ncbi:nucleotide-binding domain-containing protein [Ramaria rubella]|nr:nucleotide-binding domain-containing protein [Ramaria rubella]
MAPLKLAIVGGGPAAFYVTSRILQLLPAMHDLRIHIYDRLWAPHGLVRYGVAPDHPEVKNCTHKFDNAAADPRVTFFGNVNVAAHPQPYPPPPTAGTLSKSDLFSRRHSHAVPLPLHTLAPHYTHLVFATGAPRPLLHPALPTSPRCISALDLVHWYTKHPGSIYSASDGPIPPNIRHITLIGHGNVSLDIARLLLTSPLLLRPLDLPTSVLLALERAWHTLRHVSIVGRRGPKGVKFTAKEVREMMNLTEARMSPIPDDVWAADGTVEASRGTARVIKLLRQGSKARTTDKTFSFDFWRAPTGYTVQTPSHAQPHQLTLHFAKTHLDPTTQRLTSTSENWDIHTDLIVTSLGYAGDAALFGDGDTAQPAFTSIPTLSGGRIPHMPRNYAVGWAAHGAHGVLAGTMLDAYAVADSIIQDWSKGTPDPDTLPSDLSQPLIPLLPLVDTISPSALNATPLFSQGGPSIDYDTWQAIEAEERRRGEAKGKARERMDFADVMAYLA